jgi:hypothetical protein
VVRRRFVLEKDSDDNVVFHIRSTGVDGDEDMDGVNWSELENEDDDDVELWMLKWRYEVLATGKNNVQERDANLVGRSLQ